MQHRPDVTPAGSLVITGTDSRVFLLAGRPQKQEVDLAYLF
jgi:hypothetical protein